jgi:hypothetical protein
MKFQIPVALLEFDEGHHTLWIHSPKGATVLRIKCTGKINVSPGCLNPVAHADIRVEGDIDICVPEEVEHVH